VTTALPRPTAERIWLCYLACVVAIACCVPGNGCERHDLTAFLLLHAGVLGLVLVSRQLATRRGPDAARAARVALAVAGLPIVFSGLCWLLPGVHPEPFEFRFLALDRALFGTDVGTFADALPGVVVEVLQVCYASFYGICLAAGIGAGLGGGKAAFDRATLLLTGSFLVSYLGYLLVPTLGPKVVLGFEHEITGSWLTPWLRASIDAGEANPWDCFPSGHTMLTVTSLLILWRWNRRWFRWLLVPGALLIVSTMLLRYHWTIDVAAGLLLAWPTARAIDRLADRDGWPAAGAPSPAVTSAGT
jgi:membrane-associated phospholipid phosphatase